MMDQLRLPAIALAFAGLGAGAVVVYRATAPADGTACRVGASTMARLELLFGAGAPGGREIGEGDWRAFLDAEVTPRFPDGLTVLSGYGQWRNSAGVIAKESTRALLIWYRPGADVNANIEAIRGAYKTRFGQESVMRVDGTSCVSF
jgi:hypothetical protein